MFYNRFRNGLPDIDKQNYATLERTLLLPILPIINNNSIINKRLKHNAKYNKHLANYNKSKQQQIGFVVT